MRRFVSSSFVCLTLVLPATAFAQRGAPPFEGPRGALSFQLSDGEPVSFYLEWSRELDLTDAQKQQLIAIRRKLRAINASFVKQLDSIRQYAGLDMAERGRLTEADREALQRFQKWSQPVVDSIRVNNDVARGEIRVVLDKPQLARADSIAIAMREGRAGRPGPRTTMPRGGSPNERGQPTR